MDSMKTNIEKRQISDSIQFLKKNGFKRIESNSYANECCNVVFEDKYTAVADFEGVVEYWKGYSIFWLIGALTYHEFISKNYKS
jgi:hypothetical protein